MNTQAVKQIISWILLTSLWTAAGYFGMVEGHKGPLHLFEFMTVILTGWWMFIDTIVLLALLMKLPWPANKTYVPFTAAAITDYTLAFASAYYGHYFIAVLIVFQNFLEACYRGYVKGELQK